MWNIKYLYKAKKKSSIVAIDMRKLCNEMLTKKKCKGGKKCVG